MQKEFLNHRFPILDKNPGPGGVEKKFHTLLLALGFCLGAARAFGSFQTITNDTFWKDTNGNPIYALGGGVSKFGNTYYWYGVQYGGMATYYNTGTAGSDTSFVAVNCYSSTDLAHWTPYSPVVTTATAGFNGTSWVGRMGSVLYNASTNLYVMWIEYDGTGGDGMACLTSSTPTGNFVLHNVQTSITNVFDNLEGDSTIFCDVDHGSTPYLIFSDSHGREHAYVSPLSADYYTIEPATLISEWPQGQEGDNMFERNGVYYYLMSNLAGWSFSTAYEVQSTSILTPADYTADAAFTGTTTDDTHHSQVSFCIPVSGSVTTSYIYAGDRWSCFDDTYAKAGSGQGFNEWCPLSFNGAAVSFNSVNCFQVDTSTGEVIFNCLTPTPTPLGANSPTATATNSPTRTPTATTTRSATPTSTFTSTSTRTSTSSSTPTSTRTASPSPTDTATSTVTLTPTRTMSPTQTATPSPTATFTSTKTPTASPTSSMTPSATASRTLTASPSSTTSWTPTASSTASGTESPTTKASPTMTATDSPTPSGTPTLTPTGTQSPTHTLTATSTSTSTATPTATDSMTPSATAFPTLTATPSSTTSRTPTASSTATGTASLTATPSPTNTGTASASPTRTSAATATLTFTNTRTSTPSSTPTFTITTSPTTTTTPTFTSSETSTPSATGTSTIVDTAIPTSSMTPAVSLTASRTATPVGTGGVVLFPNPATGPGPVTLQVSLSSPGQVQITVFTTAFRKVNTITLSNVPAGTTDVVLPLTDQEGTPLANGLYYVVVRTSQGRFTTKLMILR